MVGFGSCCQSGAGFIEFGRVQANEQLSEAVLGVDVPGVSRPGEPFPGSGQVRRVDLAGEQDPEVILGGDDSGFGGLGVPGPGVGQIRRVLHRGQQHAEVGLSAGVSSDGSPAACGDGDRYIAALHSGYTHAESVLDCRLFEEGLPGSVSERSRVPALLPVVRRDEVIERLVPAAAAGNGVRAQQRCLPAAGYRGAGICQCLVHRAAVRVQIRSAFLQGAEGETEQLLLLDRKFEPAACPVDAGLDQDMQPRISRE